MTTDVATAEPTMEHMLPAQHVPPTSVLERITRSELDVQIQTAHQYARSVTAFKATAANLIRLDPETAKACWYSLRRDGKVVEGPSIRMAELVAYAWGNLRWGSRVVAESDKTITAQGYCHDLQTNVARHSDVSRRITKRDGSRYSDDMVIVTGNAAGAIAARNALFGVVPRMFVDELVRTAKAVAAGTIKNLTESRKIALAEFEKLGVNSDRVCDRLEIPGPDDITVEHLVELGGILTAIRDKETTAADEFPVAIPVEASRKGATELARQLGGEGPKAS